jgi:hypothetical protein
MEINLTTALITILGVVIGWLLNELSFLIRLRIKDRRKLKKVLFNLLNVYFYLNKLKIKMGPQVDILFNHLKKLLQEPSDPELIEFVKSTFIKNANEILNEYVHEKINSIKNNYESSLKDLSEVNPFLAYRLSDKLDIYDLLDNLESWFKKISSDLNLPNLEIEQNLLDAFQNKILKEYLDNLEAEIKKLSFSIGFLYWMKIISQLRKIKKIRVDENEIKKEFDNFLKEIINRGEHHDPRSIQATKSP